MLLELCIFGPFNLGGVPQACPRSFAPPSCPAHLLPFAVGFSLVSPELRPALKAILSFVFSIGLSWACTTGS